MKLIAIGSAENAASVTDRDTLADLRRVEILLEQRQGLQHGRRLVMAGACERCS